MMGNKVMVLSDFLGPQHYLIHFSRRPGFRRFWLAIGRTLLNR
jgi:hypothetical protein